MAWIRRTASAIALLALGCSATTGKLANLEIGMTKREVRAAMGKPSAVRGSTATEDGVVEVWQYNLAADKERAFHNITEPYWLMFGNGVLKQWGRAGDWGSAEPDTTIRVEQ